MPLGSFQEAAPASCRVLLWTALSAGGPRKEGIISAGADTLDTCAV